MNYSLVILWQYGIADLGPPAALRAQAYAYPLVIPSRWIWLFWLLLGPAELSALVLYSHNSILSVFLLRLFNLTKY